MLLSLILLSSPDALAFGRAAQRRTAAKHVPPPPAVVEPAPVKEPPTCRLNERADEIQELWKIADTVPERSAQITLASSPSAVPGRTDYLVMWKGLMGADTIMLNVTAWGYTPLEGDGGIAVVRANMAIISIMRDGSLHSPPGHTYTCETLSRNLDALLFIIELSSEPETGQEI